MDTVKKQRSQIRSPGSIHESRERPTQRSPHHRPQRAQRFDAGRRVKGLLAFAGGKLFIRIQPSSRGGLRLVVDRTEPILPKVVVGLVSPPRPSAGRTSASSRGCSRLRLGRGRSIGRSGVGLREPARAPGWRERYGQNRTARDRSSVRPSLRPSCLDGVVSCATSWGARCQPSCFRPEHAPDTLYPC